jgi:amino-acid N-acetyltransferase
MTDDVDSIHKIIQFYSGKDVILERSRDDIRSSLDNFYVASKGNEVIGIISYHDYGDHLKEIRSLGVKKQFVRHGIGTALLKHMVTDLRSRSNPRIFVLTYTPEFFQKNDFVVIPMNSLPEKIFKDCFACKNKFSCNEIALVHHSNQNI